MDIKFIFPDGKESTLHCNDEELAREVEFPESVQTGIVEVRKSIENALLRTQRVQALLQDGISNKEFASSKELLDELSDERKQYVIVDEELEDFEEQLRELGA